MDGLPLAINGFTDHVHLLVSLPPRMAISDLVRTLKANSSKWFHETFPSRLFQWQEGYSVFTVSESNRERVVRYIEGQPDHHARVSFQDELIELLKKHHVEWDPRWIWD